MRILNLHGLNGSSNNTNYKFLSEYYKDRDDVEIISPQLDYANISPSTLLVDILTECPDPDIIVGNSFGGFFAYLIGAMTGVKTYLINPCIPPHKYIKNLVPDYLYSDLLEHLWNKFSIIHIDYEMLLGDNDNILDIQTTLNTLYAASSKSKIIAGGHSLSGKEYENWFKEKLS